MSDNWRSEWSRHFDQVQWTSTTILTAGVGGLLAYCYSNFNSWVAFGGLWLTLLTVYYAASFRSTRRQIHAGITGDEKTFLTRKGSLRQWPVFLLTFATITAAWLTLGWQHRWRWRFGFALAAATVVFVIAVRGGHLATTQNRLLQRLRRNVK